MNPQDERKLADALGVPLDALDAWMAQQASPARPVWVVVYGREGRAWTAAYGGCDYRLVIWSSNKVRLYVCKPWLERVAKHVMGAGTPLTDMLPDQRSRMAKEWGTKAVIAHHKVLSRGKQ